MRTEQDVLKDFEKLGYIKFEIKFDNVDTIRFDKDLVSLYIYKIDKKYMFMKFNYGNQPVPCSINIQEHKLLNELFQIWGWI